MISNLSKPKIMKTLFTVMFFIGIYPFISAQSVGIGTTTPHASAKLEVSSVTQGMLVPRMSSVQRAQIASPAQGLLVFDLTTNSFWFRNATSWVELLDSVSTEVHRNGPNMIYTGMSDNVGVGISSPTNKVDINAGGLRTGIHPTGSPLYVTGNIGASANGIEFRHENGTQGIGFGYNTIYATGSADDQDLGLAARGLGSLLFFANGYESMRINESGNVGIDNQYPHAPLQFNNGLANRKVVLYEAANNDHQYFGLGINSSTLRYQVSTPSDNHIFYAGTSSTTSNELMRIQGNGNIGIGTTTPGYKLSVTNNFGIDANGSAHFLNVPRQMYFYEDGLPSKMILSHSPSFPTWGLQYTAANQFRFLKDSTSVMTVDLGANNVSISGELKIGYVRIFGPLVDVSGLSWGTATCNCPSGLVAIGGGYWVSSNSSEILESFANTDSSWIVDMYNAGFSTHQLQAFAICARLAN